MTRPLAVAVLSSGTLLEPDLGCSSLEQLEAALAAVRPLARLVGQGWDLVLCSDAGPQLTVALTQGLEGLGQRSMLELDAALAMAQAQVGYPLQQALESEFRLLGLDHQALHITTRVQVDIGDPTFLAPRHPVGPALDEKQAQQMCDLEGWQVRETAPGCWQRVVASPPPEAMIELPLLRHLLQQQVVPIVAGAGGIPVVRDERGLLMGVAAVVDVHATAARVADALGASLLVIEASCETVTAATEGLSGTPLPRTSQHLASLEALGGAASFLRTPGRRVVCADAERVLQALDHDGELTFTS